MKYKTFLALLLTVAVAAAAGLGFYDSRAEAAQEAAHAGETSTPEEAGHEGHLHEKTPEPSEPASHEQGEEAGHAEAGGHEHGEEEIAVLSEAQMQANHIKVEEVGPGNISAQLALPGEVRLNADRVAHVVPRVTGVVREVLKTTGDSVHTGDVMAILDSRELAMLKAEYLSAREREALAQAMFNREKSLWEQKISAEQDYLNAKQALAEAAIATRSAEQQLHALGFSEDWMKGIPRQEHLSYTRYEITAPFDGVIIEKHITLGELLKDDVSCFTIADLSSVWINLSVYAKDIRAIRKGQPVLIASGDTPAESVRAAIEYIGPLMGEETRTAIARVVLPNDGELWKPGQFVKGFVTTGGVEQSAPVVVPVGALQTFEGSTVVFAQTEKGFAPNPVTLGRSDDARAEIIKGLTPGTRIVTEGAFVIKAEIAKGIMEGKTCSGH